MTEKKFILGIDIGIKNFAVCMIEPETKAIKFWKIYDLGINFNDDKLTSISKVLIVLKMIPEHYNKVAVEAQPGKNKKMDYIEVTVLTYYSTVGMPVCRIQSRGKFTKLLNMKCPTGKKNYELRKELAVSYVEDSIVMGDPARIYFDSQEKKDDLADAYCICLLSMIS